MSYSLQLVTHIILFDKIIFLTLIIAQMTKLINNSIEKKLKSLLHEFIKTEKRIDAILKYEIDSSKLLAFFNIESDELF